MSDIDDDVKWLLDGADDFATGNTPQANFEAAERIRVEIARLRAFELKPAERATVRRILRVEAARLGYGSLYHYDQRGGMRDWPAALKRLSRIMRHFVEEPPDDLPR